MLPTFAQEEPGKRETTPFYLMEMLGVNYSSNESTRYGNFADNLGVEASFGFGKEFNWLFGWRATLGYAMNRGSSGWKEDDYATRFHNVQLFVDGTLDLTDALFPNRKGKRFNLKGLLGVGYLQTFSFSDNELSKSTIFSRESKPVFGFRGGGVASYKIIDRFAVAMEAHLMFLQDKFNGIVNKRPLDLRYGFEIGCIWFFGKKSKIVTIPVPVVVDKVHVVIPIMAYITPKVEIEKRRLNSGSAYLDFPVNETIIHPTYQRNPIELQRIRATIDTINFNSLITVTDIEIHGYASPEGPYSKNLQLAKQRTLTLKKYLKELYLFNDSIFTVESTPEDWEGLRKYVSESGMENKDTLLKIIDSNMDPDLKEKRLRKVAGKETYRFLLKEIYPLLRKSDYTVRYTIRNLSLEEGRKILWTQPKMLSLNELFLVANSYDKGTKEYKEAFKISVQIYPLDSITNLNAACIALEDRDVELAKRHLAKAGNSPEAIHARGVVALFQKEYNLARQYFIQASALGIKESEEILKQLP